MPRTARASAGGICYHVINRGNGRAVVFCRPGDYQAFITFMSRATARIPMRIVGYCLMPNHFHLVLWPYEDRALSRWMHWLMTAHVRRHHWTYGTDGRIWQGRFKAFPIQQDEHLVTVLRYVERNPLRAHLVTRAEGWPWSSLGVNVKSLRLIKPAVSLPRDWQTFVNTPQTAAELESVRNSVNRGAPYGGRSWVRTIAGQSGT